MMFLLDPQWRDWHKLWSVRLAMLWFAMSNVWVLMPAVQYYVSARSFFALSVLALASMIVARVMGQSSTSL